MLHYIPKIRSFNVGASPDNTTSQMKDLGPTTGVLAVIIEQKRSSPYLVNDVSQNYPHLVILFTHSDEHKLKNGEFSMNSPFELPQC